MNKKIFSKLSYFFFLALGIFLVWFQLAKMTPLEKEEFTQTLRTADYSVLIPIILLMFLVNILRALRWNILLGTVGKKPSMPISFAAIMAGYLANTAVPRLGEVVRCTSLVRTGDYKLEKVFGTVVAERLFDLFCYFILLLLTFLLQINILRDSFKAKFSHITPEEIFYKTFTVILIIAAVIIIARYFLNKYMHIHLISRIKHILVGFISGIKSLWHMKNHWLFLAYTIGIWGIYVYQIYLGFDAIKSLDGMGILPAFSVLALSTLSMIVTPGGLGSFPIFVMQVLTIYNVHAATGKAFGWLIWGATTAFNVVIGAIGLIVLLYIKPSAKRKVLS